MQDPDTDRMRARAPRGRPWMWIVAALIGLAVILWIGLAGTDGDLTETQADTPAVSTTDPAPDAPAASD